MDFPTSTDHRSVVGTLNMRKLVVVSSDSAIRDAVIEVAPSNVSVIISDGDLEPILAAVRSEAVDLLWDLAAEWLSPQVLIELLKAEHVERSRWFWLRREQTRWEDIPKFGQSLMLPMSAQLIVANLYPRREVAQPEIRGAFEALSLPDLLQTLGMNQRDVRVILNFDGEQGVIELRSGYLASAEFRGHRGMKAICRLLEQDGGSFSMTERPEDNELPLISSVSEALMMAIQFKDEKANLVQEVFPSQKAILSRSASMSCPVGEQTKEFQIWNLLSEPKTLRSVIENSSLPDAMILKILRDWVEMGALNLDDEGTHGPVFLSSVLERRLKVSNVAARVQDLISVCTSKTEIERVRQAWRQVDGFTEAMTPDNGGAIVEIGSLLHYDTQRRHTVVCWLSDSGDLSPWAQWRARSSLFLVHQGSEESSLGLRLLRESAYLATRDVGFNGLDILRGLERTIARLS